MQNVLQQYGLSESNCSIRELGNGLINSTWLVDAGNKKFVLQKINQQIFKNPEDIAFNIRLLADHLKQYHPDYLFTSTEKTLNSNDLVKTDEGYFRLFRFIEGSHTIDVLQKPEQAYEAARQFGKFSKLLAGLDVARLRITLPDFHNLMLRYRQFENALQQGNKERIIQSATLISFIKQHKNIVDEFEICKQQIKKRCTHHDTKISNVLFDKDDKGLCVIDLDTVMPGYFISDVGDMMRTYLCPVGEEEKDFSKIEVRKDFYDAILNGYSAEMGEELSEEEKKYFHYAGKFMIYMQAIRFLTDHINDDVYYGAKYPDHNFVRAGNQVTLLQRFMEINPG
ncbi:MAG: aminoglycoside phosphotransferase family protein [Ferruginibacter sp.]